MKIWANTIVNNEENFIWYSLISIVDFVDQILIYDTGSDDKTVQIIKHLQKIKKGKIKLQQLGKTSKNDFPKLRQKMLEESKCDWILILDGDEIWWKDSIQKLTNEIQKRGKSLNGIVVPMVVPVGDIYHLQDEQAGQYKLLGRKGHLSLRAINAKIPGLHVDWPYGKESYFDQDNKLIQEKEQVIFLDTPYFHVTHLKRSSQVRTSNKYKHELGSLIRNSFKFPEVLYSSVPAIVPSPWKKIQGFDLLKAKALTPFRKIKRNLYEQL